MSTDERGSRSRVGRFRCVGHIDIQACRRRTDCWPRIKTRDREVDVDVDGLMLIADVRVLYLEATSYCTMVIRPGRT